MKRRVPRLRTDEEAEAFLESDLSDLDFSQFKSGRLRLEERSSSSQENCRPFRLARIRSACGQLRPDCRVRDDGGWDCIGVAILIAILQPAEARRPRRGPLSFGIEGQKTCRAGQTTLRFAKDFRPFGAVHSSENGGGTK